MTQNPFLISPQDLAAVIGRDGVSIVDASWYLPAQNRFAKAEYDAGHVPGAVFFDQDDIVDPASSLPHTLPPAGVFAEKVGALGISDRDTIVVYDGMGLFSAPRAWWLFRSFGAKDVRVLDGGFPAWQAASRVFRPPHRCPPRLRHPRPHLLRQNEGEGIFLSPWLCVRPQVLGRSAGRRCRDRNRRGLLCPSVSISNL